MALFRPETTTAAQALRWNRMDAVSLTRQDLVRRGQRLEYFTVAWNSLEAVVSIVAGLIAGSVSLVGFGLDSVIEVASGSAMLWRLHHDLDRSRREQVERTTLRIVGACFIALALYIAYQSGSTLIGPKVAGTVTESSPNLQEPSAKAIATPQR
jgi:divalent metal cation (Fe/Co/Zn/Cd) transporter